MKRNSLRAAVFVAAAAVAVITTTGAAAPPSASDARAEDSPSYLIPTDLADIPAEVEMGPLPREYTTGGSISDSVSSNLLRLEVENPSLGIAGSELDVKSGKVLLYATSPAADVEARLARYQLQDAVEYRSARYDAAEIRAIIGSVVGDDGQLDSGHSVVMASAPLDGSRIDVVVDEDSAGLRSALALPDVGVDIVLSYGPAATPALRNHNPGVVGDAARYSGAYMHGGGYSCTTGFRVTRISDSTPGMASAEHCSNPSALGTQWYYNTTTGHFIGQAQGQMMPAGPGYRPDLASWTGGGAGALVPGIFIGNNTVAGSTVYAIRGAASTPVNSTVCFSGNRSGSVCGNTVTNVNVTLCYGAPYGCYDNLTISAQATGVPAAGQGDSGGPAYVSAGGGVMYAAGFISGILNGTTNCTGDSGGRLCSSQVAYSVINDVFVAGWGLNYIP